LPFSFDVIGTGGRRSLRVLKNVRRVVATLVIILALAFATFTSTARAGSWVDFTSAGRAPTAFQIKQAKAQGKELKVEPGMPLRGLLVASVSLTILLLGWVAIGVGIIGVAEPS
jgi:hypothetical protein